MIKNRLNIIATSATHSEKQLPSRSMRKKELQAQFERQWLIDPEQFNSLRNCKERERIERSWSLLCSYVDFCDKCVGDIGCAGGLFSRRIRDAGANVDAIDIAENALKQLKNRGVDRICPIQDAMPITSLEDNHYDFVVCMEVIADLPKEDHRLFFSELNRLIKPTGRVLFSTGIDIYTGGGLENLLELMQTEFDIEASIYSYHRFYIYLQSVIKAPLKFLKAYHNPIYRESELNKRAGLGKFWFKLNSLAPLAWIWMPLKYLLDPFLAWYRQSRFLLLQMEKIAHLWNPYEPSQAIFLLKRRPFQVVKEDEMPVQRPKKREVWE
jgi:2-polyprenyl-3-methyl-5-hydroxy-6-metoxy-1,4-benzoquinol methylase